LVDTGCRAETRCLLPRAGLLLLTGKKFGRGYSDLFPGTLAFSTNPELWLSRNNSGDPQKETKRTKKARLDHLDSAVQMRITKRLLVADIEAMAFRSDFFGAEAMRKL